MAKNSRKPEEEDFSLADMTDFLAKSLFKQANEPNLYGYIPHPKQLIFHEGKSYGRWFLGGNRTGKSVAGVVEDIWWATKRHPHMSLPSHQQIRGRVVGSDFINGIETVLFPIFKRWILPSDLRNGSWEDSYSKSERQLNFVDGSFIEFRSCDQELVKHAGTSRHFVHFDEEPPRQFFYENLQRLIDVSGRWWITMTPIEGMTWMYDALYAPDEEISPDNLLIVEVEQADNPYLKPEERQKASAFMDADERKKREKGTFVARGGRVLKKYFEAIHSTKDIGWRPPKDWLIYTSQDHGYRNPAAVGWHAVRQDGRKIVTFHEIYKRETLVKDIATEMLEFEQRNNLEIYLRTGDPNMKQRQGVTGTSILGEYALNGITIGVEGIPKDEKIGIDRMNEFLETNLATGEPYWEITQECKWHIREFKKLSWKSYASTKLDDRNNPIEKVHDRDNHAFDEAKYFFTFMRDLGSTDSPPENVNAPEGSFYNTVLGLSNHANPYNPVTPPTIWQTATSAALGLNYYQLDSDPRNEDMYGD